jgi:hypothetical protein
LWFSALSGGDDSSFRDRALRTGQGCFVRDVSGREYLDARSALWNAALGYRNRRIIEVMSQQLRQLPVAQIIRHDQPSEAALRYAERLRAWSQDRRRAGGPRWRAAGNAGNGESQGSLPGRWPAGVDLQPHGAADTAAHHHADGV